MKKQFKRLMSGLLVLAMILTMLPLSVAAAEDGYVATPINGLPEDNESVVIYSASAGAVFSGSADGGAVGLGSAKTNEEDDNLLIGIGAGVYKLVKNSDGTYYITCGGKYLFCDSNEKLDMKDTAEKGTKWKIEKAEGFDGYTIANADVTYNGKDIYLEYYTAIKAWTCSLVSEIYTFTFYSIDAAQADADGDGYVGQRPVSGEKPTDGQKVVIYNEYGNMTFGACDNDSTAPSMTAVESELTDGKLNPGNGTLIFNVGFDGTYYTFENGGKYLRTSANASDGSNAECLWMDELDSDYSYWTLEECTGGYIIYNKTAKYNRNKVCVEFFSNAFSGWTYNGSVNLFAMRFYAVEDSLNLGYVLNPKAQIKAENAFLGVDYEFGVNLDDLSEIESLDVTYSTDGGETVAATQLQQDGYSYSYSVPGTALVGKSSLTLTVKAKNEYDMEYTAQTTVQIKDEPLILSVSPASNEATGADKRPTITAGVANLGENPTVTMTLDGTPVEAKLENDKITYQPEKNLTDERHTVELVVTRADGKTAEITWSFFVGEAGMALYFGQIHSHTAEYSDGAGTLEDAYEYAMNTAKDVDFLIVTDHSNYFDTTSTATKTSYYDLSSLGASASDSTISKWEEARATAAAYNALREDFVAAYGYEMTWSGGPGHTNTFNTYGTVSRNNSELNNKSSSYAGMHLYNDLMVNANRGLDVDGNAVAEGVKTKYLEDAPVVSQFNHPGTTFGNFDDFAGYTPARDEVLCLVEVGNGEGAVGGSSYWPSYSEYDLALSKGWHVAPTNNQDNHKGRWGDANTCRDVILTDDFTEAGLYKAMAQRRVYSTEDQNLAIYYYVNGELMGSIIDVGEEAPKELTITASISDPDGESLGIVEIIGENGLTLAKFDAPGSTYELNTTIPNTDAYYYLKVTQADGDIAVTAPVWVGEATPIIADIDTDAVLSIAGESETITATVENSATDNYTLEKVEFTLTDGKGNDSVIKSFTTFENATVAPNAKQTFSFEYTRVISDEKVEKEDQKITVIFYGTYNGKSFKCQANMEQTVRNPQNLIKVAVDAGHDNYYITGDYSDSTGNFIEYCADNGIQCDYLVAGELTYENLKDYKMLVLTVNYRRNAAKALDYTEQELAAIAEYAKNGGNLIVCSKSDRDNTFDNCAANSNQILDAIGAKVRVVDGIIVDNDLKASEAYRLYLSSLENFNTEHRFTAGAYTSSNAYGTIPATDNESGFQLYNGAPIQILEGNEDEVDVLVRGFQSTWGSHFDGYFDSNAFVPVYNDTDASGRSTVTVPMDEVNVMTYEDLPGGGWLVVSGCTFFSNYDIKSDTDYANKFILQNILRELTGADEGVEITSIKTVKAIPEERSGEEYTIEGYVTSNASAYDQNTAFFDCIYMADENGNGINVFPVAGNYAIGMHVRAHGGVTYYCGEVELNLGTDYNGYIRIISDDQKVIRPADVDCKTAMQDNSIGNLMRVKGIVTKIHRTAGVIDKIYVRDAMGEACLFINGYIMKDYTGLDNLKVGMMVSGVGIGSRDVDETSATNAIFARLRVRDRSEIKILDNGNIHAGELFTDVSEQDWFADSVLYVVDRGLLVGTSTYTFEPNFTLTRATVATVLYRMAGEPEITTAANFDDVAKNQWYTDAISWAAANGIVNGTGDNKFEPNKEITREDMAVMLFRFANAMGVDTSARSDFSSFPDADSVYAYAKDAMRWCIAEGIINGNRIPGQGTILEPKGNATRAQFATIVMRFLELYGL